MDLRDSVNCVETCLAPVRKSDGGPTIWIGTHSGKVVSLSISVPSNAERNTMPLICAPTGILWHIFYTIIFAVFLHQKSFSFLHQKSFSFYTKIFAIFTPKFCSFYTKIFAVFTPNFCGFYTKFFPVFTQKIFAVFTPKFLQFLHQNFCGFYTKLCPVFTPQFFAVFRQKWS